MAIGDLGFRARHELTSFVVKRVLARYIAQGDPGIQLATDPLLAEDPYAFYAAQRERGQIITGSSGVMIATSRQAVEQLFRDPRMGHAPLPTKEQLREAGFLRRMLGHDPFEGMIHPLLPPSIIVVDPPDHTRYRKLVSRAFTVRRAEEMRSRIEEITGELVKAMGKRPDMDVMRDFASALPVIVIAEILGVPAEDQAKFRKWGYDVARTLDINLSYAETRDARDSLKALNSYFEGVFAERRLHPRADLVTALIEAEVDGDRLSDDELMANVLILLVAGFETTVNLLGNGANLLLDRPELVAQLLSNPALWPEIVDEVLRFDSPVQFTSRYALADLEVAGQHIPAGTNVHLLIGCANRDPASFPDPDVFDIARHNARDNLAFASGIHFCPGAALAKIEGQVGLQALFETFPDLRKRGTSRRRGSPLLRGFDSLPVRVG